MVLAVLGESATKTGHIGAGVILVSVQLETNYPRPGDVPPGGLTLPIRRSKATPGGDNWPAPKSITPNGVMGAPFSTACAVGCSTHNNAAAVEAPSLTLLMVLPVL